MRAPMTDGAPRPRGVQLEAGATASALLQRMLAEAIQRFPSLSGVSAPTGPRFRRTFGRVLAELEARRAGAADRTGIATFLADRSQAQLWWSDGEGREVPLREHLQTLAAPLETRRIEAQGARGWEPEVPVDGRARTGDGLRELVEHHRSRHFMTSAAAEAIHWVLDEAATDAGRVRLDGHKFVVLGAAAELAPTRLLLRAGAEVLWIDIHPPSQELGGTAKLGGALEYCPGGADLLTQPAEIVATIRRFAGDDQVHLGMFAYRAGQGREWRLEGVMNAIARALGPQHLASASFYVSPTSAHVIQPEDLEAARNRAAHGPAWERALRMARLLEPAPLEEGGIAVARAVVHMQGASYQAAQYVSKLMTAEAFTRMDGKRLRVSANVAGITDSGSMAHPVFQAGFAGASLFGVNIFAPETTRALSALLLLHDVLHPDWVGIPPARLLSQQIHGGVFAMPDSLESAIRVAALVGLGRKPSLIPKLFRR